MIVDNFLGAVSFLKRKKKKLCDNGRDNRGAEA